MQRILAGRQTSLAARFRYKRFIVLQRLPVYNFLRVLKSFPESEATASWQQSFAGR